MTIYYVIFAALILFSFFENFAYISNSQKRIVVLGFTFLYIFLSTIYYGENADREVYEMFFNAANIEMVHHPFDGWFEYLYTLLILLIKAIHNNYVFSRFIIATIVMMIWYRILTDEDDQENINKVFMVMLVIWSLYLGNIFIARSTIAMTICIGSIKYIKKKDIPKFIFWSIIAVGFHTMTFIWLAAYWLYHKAKTKVLLFASIISAAITLLLPNIINQFLTLISRHSPYLVQRALQTYLTAGIDKMYGMEYDMRTTTIKAMANMALLLVLFLYLYKRSNVELTGDQEKFTMIQGEFNLYIFGTILYELSLGVSIALSRAAMPFTLVSAFLIPELLYLPEYRREPKSRLIAFFIFILYLSLRFVMNLKGIGDFITK